MALVERGVLSPALSSVTVVRIADEQELPDDIETAKLIFDQTRGGPARQAATADANDSKAFQVFSAATVVLGFGAFSRGGSDAAAWLYGAAVVAYALAGYLAWQVVRPRGFKFVDAADRWWPRFRAADTDYTRAKLLEKLARAADHNRRALEAKAGPLTFLLPTIALEAILVAASIITRLV